MSKSDKYDWEWSERHVRLKYQMVLSSVAFWLLCRFELRYEWTFIFLPIDGVPSQFELIGLAFVFYLFMTGSFWIQSKNERNHFDIRFRILEDAAKEKASVFTRVEQAFEKGVKNPFQKLEQEMALYGSTPEGLKQNTERTLSQIESLCQQLRALSNEIESSEPELYEMVKDFYYYYPPNANEFNKYKSSQLEKVSDSLKQTIGLANNGKSTFVAPRIAGLAYAIEEDIRVSRETTASTEFQLDQAADKFSTSLKSCKRSVQELSTEVTGLIEGVKVSSEEMIIQLNDFVTKSRVEGERANNFINLGRDGLDYWGPIIASGVFVLLGSYSLVLRLLLFNFSMPSLS